MFRLAKEELEKLGLLLRRPKFTNSQAYGRKLINSILTNWKNREFSKINQGKT